MKDDLVSIIMPSYNCGKYVEQTIRSVQSQTYQNWEIIFMDDCSKDDTIRRVKDLRAEDPRIKLYQNKYNSEAVSVLFFNGLVVENLLDRRIESNGNPVHVLDNLLTTRGRDFVKFLKD